jgi:cobalt/nickel transport system permease protein
VSPAARIVVALAGVTLVALWPPPQWPWQSVPVTSLLLLSVRFRLPWRPVLRRALLVWGLVGLIALGMLGQPHWPLRVGNLLLKATLSLWALSLLVHTTPLPDLVAGLRRLGVPAIWTGSLAFWGRYYAVLGEEWRRLQLARRARTFTRDRAFRFRALANALGLLFIRAYERAEKVHRAMLARGYRGEP